MAQTGSGTIDYLTQRMLLAKDSPGVVGLATANITLGSILSGVESYDTTLASLYVTQGSIYGETQSIDIALGSILEATEPVSSAPSYGRVEMSVSASAIQLSFATAKREVIVTAEIANATPIYLGFSSVVALTTYFLELDPGDRSLDLKVDNLDKVWLYSTFVAGATPAYTYAVF